MKTQETSKSLEILLDVHSDLLYGGKFWRQLPWEKQRIVKSVMMSLDQTIEFIEAGRLIGTQEDFNTYYELKKELTDLKLPTQEIGRTN